MSVKFQQTYLKDITKKIIQTFFFKLLYYLKYVKPFKTKKKYLRNIRQNVKKKTHFYVK